MSLPTKYWLQLNTLTDPGESWDVDFVLSGLSGIRRAVRGLQPVPLRWTSVDLLTRYALQEVSAPVMAHNRAPVILKGLAGFGDCDSLVRVEVSRAGNPLHAEWLSFGRHGLLYRHPNGEPVPDSVVFPPGALQIHFSRESGDVLHSPATVLPYPTPRVSSTCCAWSHKLHLYDSSGLLEEGMIHYDRHGWPAASRWGSDWFELIYSRPTL